MKKIFSKNFWADQDIEMLIGRLLRSGVVTASAIVLFGGVVYLVRHGSSPIPPYHTFTGESAGYTTMREILNGVGSFKGRGIIQLGVVVLIATPILRIFFSLIGFILEKDKLYIAITFIVLCVILFSMFGGLKV